MTKTKEWFISRISKKIWRNEFACKCETCTRIFKEGLVLRDRDHALYTFDAMSISNYEGFPLDYFDSEIERDEYVKEMDSCFFHIKTSN